MSGARLSHDYNAVYRTDHMITVTLVCGCRVKSSMPPTPRRKYACTSNMGHSYNQTWTTATYPDGRTSTNGG